MSKIIFEPEREENVRITVIWRGVKKSKYNHEASLTTKEYAKEVKKFLKRRNFKSLAYLMNTTNSVYFDPTHRDKSFKSEIYAGYFFILHLLFALEEKLEVVDKGDDGYGARFPGRGE